MNIEGNSGEYLDYEQESAQVQEKEKDLDEEKKSYPLLQCALRLRMFSREHVAPFSHALSGRAYLPDPATKSRP